MIYLGFGVCGQLFNFFRHRGTKTKHMGLMTKKLFRFPHPKVYLAKAVRQGSEKDLSPMTIKASGNLVILIINSEPCDHLANLAVKFVFDYLRSKAQRMSILN